MFSAAGMPLAPCGTAKIAFSNDSPLCIAKPPLDDRLQDFHAGEAVALLVEIVEIVAVGETLLQVVVVAEQLVIGGEGEVE